MQTKQNLPTQQTVQTMRNMPTEQTRLRLKSIRAECGIYPHARISSATLQRAILFRGINSRLIKKRQLKEVGVSFLK